jgi:hypothetical protein
MEITMQTFEQLTAEYEAHDFEGLTPISADELWFECVAWLDGEPSKFIPADTPREVVERQRAYLADFSMRWEKGDI